MTRFREWLQETHSTGFELRRHFFLRFFDSDLVSTPGQWQVVAGGTLAVLLSLSLIFTVVKVIDPASTVASLGYLVALDLWLLATVLFAAIIACGGRPVRTTALAKAAGVSREHLSRNFSVPGSPNLKRVIDLLRQQGVTV